MKKTRVYLAKSNRADPNVVGYVRQHLTGSGYEVVEYNGRVTYTHKDLLSCDRLILVPEIHKTANPVTSNQVFKLTIGRGLYEQLVAWRDNTDVEPDVITVLSHLNNQIYSAMIESISIIDPVNPNWVTYAKLTLERLENFKFMYPSLIVGKENVSPKPSSGTKRLKLLAVKLGIIKRKG
jgi:hypothetical protein